MTIKKQIVWSFGIGLLLAVVAFFLVKQTIPCESPAPFDGYYPAQCVSIPHHGWPISTSVVRGGFTDFLVRMAIPDWLFWSVIALLGIWVVGKMKRKNL
jgi:hypothetical protein